EDLCRWVTESVRNSYNSSTFTRPLLSSEGTHELPHQLFVSHYSYYNTFSIRCSSKHSLTSPLPACAPRHLKLIIGKT
ncbi:hypothetical protein BGY98DRAFT_1026884, partial [Russula aff. rugulosa BPL654]